MSADKKAKAITAANHKGQKQFSDSTSQYFTITPETPVVFMNGQ